MRRFGSAVLLPAAALVCCNPQCRPALLLPIPRLDTECVR